MAGAIAHASIARSQGGPSNLQRFRAHHPPTFTGGGDPMVVDHWFMQIEKVLEAMEITFVRPKKFQFLEKGQNRNFGYKIIISVKNPEFIP